MLQPAEMQRLEYLLEDVKRLNLRFPIARIAEKTGFDKGYISRLMKGKIPVSDNFLSKFYQAFKVDTSAEGQNTSTETEDPEAPYRFSAKKSDVETLLEIVTKLSESVNNQSSALRDQSSALKDQAEALKSLTTNRGNANGHTATAV